MKRLVPRVARNLKPPGYECGVETRVSLETLMATLRSKRSMAPPTVYVDGVFDLFHRGHVAYLRRCRELLPAYGARRLLVGVVGDEDAASYKRAPVLTLSERADVVEACSLVDEVLRAPPLVLTEAFLKEHGVVRVVHGDDDPQSAFFRVPLRLGIMSYVPYTRGISTSDIIARMETQVSSRPEA